VKYPTFITRCVVNPVIGREYESRFVQVSTGKRKVMVVGGGPGGMQAAITATNRGHEVVLCEKSSRLGGALVYSEREYFKEDTKKLIEVLSRRVHERPLRLMMDTEVTPKLVEEISPDVLIVAVGADPFIPEIPGVNNKNVVVAASMYDEEAIGEKVVVVGGGLVGCEKGLHLAHLGRDVTILEMLEKAASDAPYLHWLALMKELEKSVRLETSVRCIRIIDEGAFAVSDEGYELFFEADTVLLATGMKPRTDIVESLRGCAPDFVVIGDCQQPGTVMEAIHFGYFSAMNI
jgi:pyruvate/2-oxoglutarate dehydrogenase complex dihydrolipoamide dehydrogenase (E3) component